MPCVYLCVHDLWKVISWVHRHPFFVELHYEKKNAINPRCAIVIYHSLYLVIFLYMQNKFCVFFLFIDSSLMLCSNSALTGGQILSGGGQWRGRQSLDRDHPPPSGSESCCMDRAWRSCFSASPFLYLGCVSSCPVTLGRLQRGTPGCRDWSTLTSSFAGLLGLSDN